MKAKNIGDSKQRYCRIIKYILLVESIAFIISGVLVTNMHPLWIHTSVSILLYSILITGAVWVVLCRYR